MKSPKESNMSNIIFHQVHLVAGCSGCIGETYVLQFSHIILDDFQTPPPDKLSDPNLTPLLMNQGSNTSQGALAATCALSGLAGVYTAA